MNGKEEGSAPKMRGKCACGTFGRVYVIKEERCRLAGQIPGRGEGTTPDTLNGNNF
jgi:hypothetical protein